MGKQPQTAEVNPTSTYGADVDNFINALKEQPYMQKLYNAPIQERLSDEQIAEKVANGLNLGIPELAQAQKDAGIRIPQGTEQVAQAQLGEFNKPMVVAGINNVPREGGLIQGYKQGYNLNYDNPTNTVGTRIGQGLGTLGRFADSPLGRGLIAYGLSNAMGDTNPLEQAFTAGVGRQNNITRDKAYRQSLIKMGVDEAQVNAIPGIITDDVYKNWIDALNTQEMRKYREAYLTNQQEQNKIMNQYRQDQLKYQQMQDAYDRAQKNREFDYRASQDAINNEFKRRGLDIRANKQNAYDKKIRGNIQTNKALVQKIDTLIKDIENPANKGATGLIVGSLAKNPGDWQKALVNNRSTQGQLGVRGGISDIRSATLVDRTGTAQTATEMANLAPYLPDVTDSAKVAADKLRNMKKYILQETNLYEKNYSDSNINNDNDNGGWAF